ncbi:hypothetical protein EA58_06785 [Photobacterium galatheae]|uniref:Uncharacterized protein n=1 Tax=Photobacterium galatheae TaxID=1654360 RepID=A0A066RPM5_9GAMM|nr:hypothetical protein EA58_06785 [Photobacterium galatheae]
MRYQTALFTDNFVAALSSEPEGSSGPLFSRARMRDQTALFTDFYSFLRTEFHEKLHTQLYGVANET